MNITLKPVRAQTIVITGASSGIGLCTARMAAQRGAKLVLAARSEQALRQLTDEINAGGGDAMLVVADVTRQEDVRRIASSAIERFGAFDTWVNDAGIGMYGKIEDVAIEDMRKLFDTNFWGLVYGSLEAVKHLKSRGGALINLGSSTSDAAAPLLGIYSASKQAIKGFTDALRMEIENDGAQISVSLIRPGPIDTPFPMNAKNYLDVEPQHVPPVYAPEAVAEAILHCAENRMRDVYVGGGSKGQSILMHHTPRVADKVGEKFVLPGTESGKPPLPRNALDAPSERLSERGDYPGHVSKTSVYTQASLHPVLTGLAIAGAVLAVAGIATRNSRNGGSASQSTARQPSSS